MTDFVITYSETESDNLNDKETVRIPIDQLSTIISPLEPCTSYEFQIQATNKHAVGVMSPPESAITDPVGKSEPNKWDCTYLLWKTIVDTQKNATGIDGIHIHMSLTPPNGSCVISPGAIIQCKS